MNFRRRIGVQPAVWLRIAGCFALLLPLRAAAEIEILSGPDTGAPVRGISVAPPRGAEYPVSASAKSDRLDFLNGDRLGGTLESIRPGPFGVAWKREDLQAPLAVGTGGLSRIVLAGRTSASHKKPTAFAQLEGPDGLPGDVASLDGSSLLLDTWYAGRVTVRRDAVRKLILRGGRDDAIYEGPTGMEGWAVVGSAGRRAASWRFADGALQTVQAVPLLRRFDKLPDLCEFRFRASWAQDAQFSFWFFTEVEERNEWTDGYMLTISGSSVYLHRCERNSGQRNFAQGNWEKLADGRRGAEFTILANRKTKTFTVLIDGEVCLNGVDNRNPQGAMGGSSILLQPQSAPGFRISRIRIAEWDGVLPGATERVVTRKEDMVMLRNGDKLTGRVEGVTVEIVRLVMPYGGVDIPIDRVDTISFATPAAGSPAPAVAGMVRLILVEGGVLTGRLREVAADTVKISGDAFGGIALPLAAAGALHFDLRKDGNPAVEDDIPPDEDGGLLEFDEIRSFEGDT